MSIFLASQPVSAAVCAGLPVNLISRRRASVHDVDEATLSVELLVTVSLPNQAASTVLPFIIVDDTVGFEVVLGLQWETWCEQNRGPFLTPFFSLLFSVVVLMPCPLSVVDVAPDVYNKFSSIDHDVHRNDFCYPASIIEQLEQSSACAGPSSAFSVTQQEPQSSRNSAHAILHDMFLSRRVTGTWSILNRFECLLVCFGGVLKGCL